MTCRAPGGCVALAENGISPWSKKFGYCTVHASNPTFQPSQHKESWDEKQSTKFPPTPWDDEAVR